MSNANVQSGATQNTGAVIDHSIHVLPERFQDAAKKAVNADKLSVSRWDAFRAVAADIHLKALHCKSPHNKKGEGSPDDPVILRDNDERITSTRGEVYADVRNMAYGFLSAVERKLVDIPAKSLDEDGRVAKRKAHQAIGSYVSKFANQLGKLEDKAEGRTPSRNKSVAVRIAESLTNAKKWVQADDEPNYDVREVIAGIDRAMLALHDAIPHDPESTES